MSNISDLIKDYATASNAEYNTITTFLKRDFWASVMPRIGAPLDQTINYWTGTGALHGKTSPTGDLCYLSETNLKQYSSPIQKSQEVILGVDFVVDAFLELQTHFMKAHGLKKLNRNGLSEIRNLVPKKGWSSFVQGHNEHLVSLYDIFVTKRLHVERRHHKIKNLDTYIKELLEFLIFSRGLAFMTMSAYASSKICPNDVSGLKVEIAKLPKSADSIKVEWLQDPNYDFYRSSAQNHGFMIDYNAPWSLTADIRHPVMKKHMEAYGITPPTLFSEYYYKTGGLNDYANLKEFLMSSYNAYVESYPTYQEYELCDGGDNQRSTKVKNLYRERLDLWRFEKVYNDAYWLELYYFIRLTEMRIKKSNQKFNNDVKKIMQIYNYKGLDFALEYVNILLKNTRTPILL